MIGPLLDLPSCRHRANRRGPGRVGSVVGTKPISVVRFVYDAHPGEGHCVGAGLDWLRTMLRDPAPRECGGGVTVGGATASSLDPGSAAEMPDASAEGGMLDF